MHLTNAPFTSHAPYADHATIDFEAASVAGFVWDDVAKKWRGPPGAPQNKKGLPVVGASVYAEHPSTRILTLSYQIPGQPLRRWQPGVPLPQDLFDWIAAGGRIEAHNVMFERLLWYWVCERRHGFPPLPPEQLSCSMATARVNSYPGGLGDLGEVLQLDVRKNKDGRRLLTKFSVPRNPTKSDPRVWIMPEDDPADAENLYVYCDEDVATEQAASRRLKPMSIAERGFWLVDQEINWRGLGVDRPAIRDCIAVLNQALAHYGDECRQITGGLDPTQLEKLKGWLAAHHVYVDSLDADHIEALLESPRLVPHPPGGINPARRVVEIRALIGSATVKKIYAMENMASADNRLRNLIVHHGARTGRPTGEGAQPLNMLKAGPKLATCGALPGGGRAPGSCGKPYKPAHTACPWCDHPATPGARTAWTPAMAEPVLEIMASRSLELVEWFFGDALLCIGGCSRGLFVAEPGHDLIASDYSSIEAVVTGYLAGETWRMDVFQSGADIYLASASRITGTPVEEYLAYYAAHGEHHPDRVMGKISELALGFGGWIAALTSMEAQYGVDLKMDDDQKKSTIKAWRNASPNVVELWGGQWRGLPWDMVNGRAERFGFEGMAINAIQFPGTVFEHAGIKFERRINGPDDALIVTLLSTRELTYHFPELQPSTRQYASPGELSITYMTWNSNPKYGYLGWVRMSTYGSRLAENIVQAIAHDILRHAILNLRAAGYPTVLHVYDEIITEIPSPGPAMPRAANDNRVADPWVANVERIMAIMPPWAAGWPIRANGGWRGRRYRKG